MRVAGRTDIEDAFQRLDILTKDEGLMTAARNLEMTHHVDDNVTTIKEVIHDVDSNLNETKQLTYKVGDDIKVIEQVARNIDDNVKATKDCTHCSCLIFSSTD